jgi:hypothetical protein
MRLVQYLTRDNIRYVGKVGVDETSLQVLAETDSVYDLAMEAGRTGAPIIELVSDKLIEVWVDYDEIIREQRVLPPLDHPDPAHCLVTGTGLTHLGSAQARDAMHTKEDPSAPLTDSMRLFRWGLEGGKPNGDKISVQPEWFYKGNGDNVVPPEQPLSCPSFALDGGEEAELVGLYVVSEKGEVMRVGFALGNEFSDHVMEAQNYLYLAHSKLRTCSFGPEIRIGDAPLQITGTVRIERDGRLFWEADFLTGEENMSYTIASLEHHHFKYGIFRSPGDVHCHFFGTATLSRNAGVITQPGDVFEISAPGYGRPLRNSMMQLSGEDSVFKVRVL